MVGVAIAGAAVIGAGASMMAADKQAQGAEKAGEQSLVGQMLAIEEQRRQFDTARADLAPYRQTGQNALGQYAALFGISGRDPTNNPEFLNEQYQTGTEQYLNPAYAKPAPYYGEGAGVPGPEATTGVLGGDANVPQYLTRPTYSTRQIPNAAYNPNGAFLSNDEQQAARDRFLTTPGYKFRFEEGQRAVERAGSARGQALGGRTARELVRYGEGLASSEFENYANRLAGIAGMGQGATTATATLGQQTGANIGQAFQTGAAQQGQASLAAGTARASGFAGAANAFSGGISNYLTYQSLQNNQSSNSGGAPFG